jgi:hypothetical protein
MKILHETDVLSTEDLSSVFADLRRVVFQAVRDGQPLHKVEETVWRQVLHIGRQVLEQFLALLGTGDMGETVTLPSGETCSRLEKLHERRYVSIFGEFRLKRLVYGSRDKQKIDFVPLDNRLQLPEGAFSYLLQDWDQSLCVEEAFARASTTVARMLGLKQSVDSLEHMNQEMAHDVTNFMLTQPVPKQEGEIVVSTADQKGIVMRRQADDPPPKAHRTKGDKASQKRMATVGAVYTVDRYVRTPEEVLASLFRDTPEPARDRPKPQHKEA